MSQRMPENLLGIPAIDDEDDIQACSAVCSPSQDDGYDDQDE
jgi:hypothetical protein